MGLDNSENKRIKILYVQAPGGGGSLLGLYELLKQLNKNEIEPVALCYYKNQYTKILETIPGVKVLYIKDEAALNDFKIFTASKFRYINILQLQLHSIKKYFINDKALMQVIYRILKNEKPELVHHFNDIIDNRHAVRACIKAHIPQIMYNHTLGSYGRNYVNYLLDYRLIKSIAFHIHMTEAVYKHFKKLFNLSETNSLVFHDFVDTDNFKPSPFNHAIKNEFKISEEDFVITNIGRILNWKGQHILIEAINLIKNRAENFKIFIVGPYDKGVGSKDYYDYLISLTAKYNLQNIIFFTGNRTDIANIISASDVIIHTAVKPEPQGIIILEALLCNKPVIATDAGGAAELIKKYGGYLVKPSDATALAELIFNLITRRKLHQNFAPMYPVNYNRLKTDFDTGNKMHQMMSIYHRVLNNNKD